jgi:hypothetical protein
VVDAAGLPVSGFKYTIQEDTTFAVDPANPPAREDMLSFGFHASNHPPARAFDGTTLNGTTDADNVQITQVPPGRYFVSVLPYSGYAMSGQPVNVLPNADPLAASDDIQVVVEQHPIPTAQMTIFLFEDNYPLNGTPDLPEEENPPAGEVGADGLGPVDWTQFSITLEDPAGLYGQQGGPVLQDAFGNQLGTTYLPNCDPNTADCVDVAGDGTLHPDENGYLTIKNLAPGKYGVIVTPPGANPAWVQVSTIEGTKVIDAWVKANEPPFFVEFGLPGPHVFMGFVKTDRMAGLLGGGTNTVTGTITDMHMSRSPDFSFYSGRPLPGCWVAINEGGLVPGRALYAAPCDGNSGFSIPNVPDGSYQLKVWDINLDAVIATLPLTITNGACNALADCQLGEVPVFNWFARLNTAIFNDTNQNGFWDAGEGPVGPEAGPVGIRWRNGAAYQAFPTDTEGFAPFDEVFPFFHWLVAEVGFTNKKPTGATYVVDAGGGDPSTGKLFPDQGWAFPSFDELNPQAQVCTPAQSLNPDDPDAGCTVGDPINNPNTGNNWSRTETGPVLTQAFQAFLGQTNVLWFGKTEYLDYVRPSPLPFTWTYVGENGGISGIVHYAITRAENDPRDAVGETWEPGVPRVQVALYADGDIDCDTNPAAGPWPAGDCDIDWNNDGIRQPNLGTITSLDGVDDDGDGNLYDLADVDNYPLGWADPNCVNDPAIPGNECQRGGEDVDRDDPDRLVPDAQAVFEYGDALQVVWTDSWDDNQPTGCQGANQIDVDLDGIITPEEDARCFDGLRNFNQVRPGVFDGGYAFADYNLANPKLPAGVATKLNAFYADRQGLASAQVPPVPLPDAWIIPGDYIVEAATPPGYELVKEEDKNVDFGDQYIPSTQALNPVCVGDVRTVPPYLSFATTDGSGDLAALIPGFEDATVPAEVSGDRPLCDRKAVGLSAAQNAAANFFLFTDVPIAANATGVILNDLANEFNPNSPTFGEKYAPPYVPVAFYDWNGKQVNRVYADEFGRYNAMLPSTYSVNLPMPSGVSPNMLIGCMNDAGPIPNPELLTNPDAPETIIDPNFNPQYSQFCYTFQYMPGDTTYLDTPVVSIAAFANPPQFPVDCDREDRTPMIASVQRRNGSGGGGPFVAAGGTVTQPQQIRINSMGGQVTVPNPAWDGTAATEQFITRNYNFGGQEGVAQLEDADGNRTNLNIVSWSGTRIFAEVDPNQAPGDYQVIVTRTGGVPVPVESPLGVTLTVGVNVGGTEYGVRPNSDGAPYGMDEVYAIQNVGNGGFATIQEAIDFANPGDLILVAPGTYDELVMMWKPVKLQGWGAGAVTLQARQVPTEKIANWRALAESLVNNGLIDLLPGQELAPTGFPALGAPLFPTEEGAGIFVAGRAAGIDSFQNPANRGARIDGFTIVGATQGGAIVVNGHGDFLNIGNNRLTTNAGFYGGGIRVGHPTLSHQDADTGLLVYDDADNNQVRIHHNHIVKNGGINADGVGGGISLNTGADAYKVQKNWVCGNFSVGSGAGIGHLGFSNGGLIEDNTIVFNESFSQATAESGGGIYVGGQPGLQALDLNGQADPAGYLVSPGTGTVTIDANRIRGNLAGAGDGGGIRIENANGEDILASLGDIGPWRDVLVFNNMITNNVAGLAGGGISVENSLRVVVRNNTVANNDSTATTALASSGDPNFTTPPPAGIVARGHTGDMGLLMAEVTDPALQTDWLTFSDPVLVGNIVYQNRSFFWWNFGAAGTVTSTSLFPAGCTDSALPTACPDFYDDLAVLGAAGQLDPRRSLLTDTTENAVFIGSLGNITGDPAFVSPYFNGPRDNLNIPEFTTLQTAGAFDEGGNFIQVTYGPLSVNGYDYHITGASAAANQGGAPGGGRLAVDFDNDTRSDPMEIGADELQ